MQHNVAADNAKFPSRPKQRFSIGAIRARLLMLQSCHVNLLGLEHFGMRTNEVIAFRNDFLLMMCFLGSLNQWSDFTSFFVVCCCFCFSCC